MDKTFKYDGGKQCDNCAFCALHNGRMRCDLFVMPYFVWHEYWYEQVRGVFIKRGMKRGNKRKPPATCWGFANQQEYERRIKAVEKYKDARHSA